MGNDIEIKGLSQPFFFELSGDSNIDFIYTDRNGNLMVAKHSGTYGTYTHSRFLTLISPKPECNRFSENFILAQPQSSAYTDFNGDCMADLYLTLKSTTTGELVNHLLINEVTTGKFCLVESYSVPGNIPTIYSFADFDRNSMADLVYEKDNKIMVHYNKLVPAEVDQENLCAGVTSITLIKSTGVFDGFGVSASNSNGFIVEQRIDIN